jgi:hypothetical protein
MDFSQVRLGARIEFYEELGRPDSRPLNYLAAATKNPAFVGAACPQAGDHVSAESLAGGEAAIYSMFITERSPDLPVVRVEHDLVPLDGNDEIPSWWDPKWSSPSVTLVFHVEARRDEDFRQGAFAEALRRQGWGVLAAGSPG